MKIKIKNDPNNVISELFQDEDKRYNYLKGEITLYLIYGENVKWNLDKKSQKVQIIKDEKIIQEMNRNEWKQFWANNMVSFDSRKNIISTKAPLNVELDFLELLDKLKVEYKKDESKILNKIIKGESFDEIDLLLASVK